MAGRSTMITLNMTVFALLSFTLHFQAQAQGALGPTSTAGGEADTAAEEFVLLESIRPERRLLAATTSANAVNATGAEDTEMTELACLECHCCIKKKNQQVCHKRCCYQSTCGESVCSIPEVVSCGCNHCVPPPAHHSHRPPPPHRTN